MRGKEYAVRTADVLKLVERTCYASYDCEYAALAGGRKLTRRLPEVAILLEDFVS